MKTHTHWIIAVSFVVLGVTGVYIGHPFLTVTGEATQHFAMGWIRAIHFYFAIAFVLAVVARIASMFWSKALDSAMIVLLDVVLIATGFAMYSASAPNTSVMQVFRMLIPFVGGLQTARLVHHVTMWLVVGVGMTSAMKRP